MARYENAWEQGNWGGECQKHENQGAKQGLRRRCVFSQADCAVWGSIRYSKHGRTMLVAVKMSYSGNIRVVKFNTFTRLNSPLGVMLELVKTYIIHVIRHDKLEPCYYDHLFLIVTLHLQCYINGDMTSYVFLTSKITKSTSKLSELI